MAESGSGMLAASLPEGPRGGLQVAGGLAQRLGGTITVRRRAGEGTTYRVQLPTAPGVPSCE